MHRIMGRCERIPVSKPSCPCLFRTVQQRNEIDIVPNRQSCQRDDVRECEFALCLVLHYSQEEIGYHGHPYLDFNGVDVVAKEVFKRKILLQFLEKALNSPASAVGLTDLFCRHFVLVQYIGNECNSVLPVISTADNPTTAVCAFYVFTYFSQIWDGDHVYDSVLPVSRDVSEVNPESWTQLKGS